MTLAAYDAGPPTVAYVEPVGVGDVLPDMPLFLRAGVLRPGPAGGDLPDVVEALPGRAQAAT